MQVLPLSQNPRDKKNSKKNIYVSIVFNYLTFLFTFCSLLSCFSFLLNSLHFCMFLLLRKPVPIQTTCMSTHYLVLLIYVIIMSYEFSGLRMFWNSFYPNPYNIIDRPNLYTIRCWYLVGILWITVEYAIVMCCIDIQQIDIESVTL